MTKKIQGSCQAAGCSGRGRRFTKGSAEAKAHMAALRSRRPLKQAGGTLGLVAMAVPTLLGFALKAAASYGVKKAAGAAIAKVKGGGKLKKWYTKLSKLASGPLKQEAVKILDTVRGNPEKVESALVKLIPVITQIAQQVLASQSGGSSIAAVGKQAENALESPGFHSYMLSFIGREMKKELTELANNGVKKVLGGNTGTYGPSKPGFTGEKHVPMMVPGSLKPQRANFAGPGTKLRKRLARGDKPINEVDRVAKAHDLRYGLSQDYQEVRRADQKMLAALGKIKGINVQSLIAQGVMKSKIAIEDTGVVGRDFFAQHGADRTASTLKMYAKSLKPLAQAGLGRKNRFAKGSAEAKQFMASLRARRGKKG